MLTWLVLVQGCVHISGERNSHNMRRSRQPRSKRRRSLRSGSLRHPATSLQSVAIFLEVDFENYRRLLPCPTPSLTGKLVSGKLYLRRSVDPGWFIVLPNLVTSLRSKRRWSGCIINWLTHKCWSERRSPFNLKRVLWVQTTKVLYGAWQFTILIWY